MKTIVGTSAEDAAFWLSQGEPVALPTETVYGLAADAMNTSAVEKVFECKGRPKTNPLIVHIEDHEQMRSLAFVDGAAADLASAFWPGPLTLILKKKDCISDTITAGSRFVALRSPRNSLFKEVLRLLKVPLVAPSANKFKEVSPTTAAHVLNGLGGKIAYILDGGMCTYGLESTIISLADSDPKILRPGPISISEIEGVIGKVTLAFNADECDNAPKLAPGLFKKHYSPKTDLVLTSNIHADYETSKNVAFVFFSKSKAAYGDNCFYLSECGDLFEAAHNLFDVIQRLDSGLWHKMYIELAPNIDIGIAINNRLTKAAAKD